VGNNIVTLPEDRQASPVKNQENIDRFLWPEGSDRSRFFVPPGRDMNHAVLTSVLHLTSTPTNAHT
jgi:hypothetical protein